MERDERKSILLSLPKVDLHRHFEGSLRLLSLVELAQKNNIDLPFESIESVHDILCRRNTHKKACQDALPEFCMDFTKSYSDIERLAAEVVSDAYAEGLVYLELRLSPSVLCSGNNLQWQSSVEALCTAALSTAAELDLKIRFVLSCHETFFDYSRWKSLLDFACRRPDLALAGVELDNIQSDWQSKYSQLFRRLLDLGIFGLSLNLSDDIAPNALLDLIVNSHASRVTLKPQLLSEHSNRTMLRICQIGFEVCPISSGVDTTFLDAQINPFRLAALREIAISINSDMTTLIHSTLLDDYDWAYCIWGCGFDDLLQQELCSVDMAFMSADDKVTLRQKVLDGYQAAREQGIL